MTWTSDPPTAPGFCWFRQAASAAAPRWVRVFHTTADPGWLVARCLSWRCAVRALRGEWSGPVAGTAPAANPL